MAEQGIHKPLVGSSNLPLATLSRFEFSMDRIFER